MFKKPIVKYILISLCWLISIGGVVVLMSFINIKKSQLICKDVKVYIPGNQYFIDMKEIDNILDVKSHTLIGRTIEDINIQALESKLKANPFIESAKVYIDMDAVIRVEITQRQPILRIINQNDQDFYVDSHGLKIPLSENFTARVLVANGFIDEPFSNKVDTMHTELATEIYKTADYIRKDSLWDAQIAQIYVNQRILLGNADSLDTKFHNLLIFYKKALPQVGWGAYKIINIKYANQVIGVKNQMTKQDSIAAVTAKKDSVIKNSIELSKDTSQIKK
jgi:cell division protein FtsQ